MPKSNLAHSLSTNPNIVKVKSILARLKTVGERKGIQIKTHTDESLAQFLDTEQERQDKVIQDLDLYTTTLESVPSLKSSETMSLTEDLECLQYALDTFSFETEDDDFSFIDDGDVIEIYSAEGMQLWRNLALINLNVYDVLTTMTQEWFKLYERSTVVNESIQKRAMELMMSDNNGAEKMGVEPHTMKAKTTEEAIVVGVSFKFFKPLFSQASKQKVGFIVTSTSTKYLLTDDDARNFSHI